MTKEIQTNTENPFAPDFKKMMNRMVSEEAAKTGVEALILATVAAGVAARPAQAKELVQQAIEAANGLDNTQGLKITAFIEFLVLAKEFAESPRDFTDALRGRNWNKAGQILGNTVGALDIGLVLSDGKTLLSTQGDMSLSKSDGLRLLAEGIGFIPSVGIVIGTTGRIGDRIIGGIRNIPKAVSGNKEERKTKNTLIETEREQKNFLRNLPQIYKDLKSTKRSKRDRAEMEFSKYLKRFGSNEENGHLQGKNKQYVRDFKSFKHGRELYLSGNTVFAFNNNGSYETMTLEITNDQEG